MVCMVPTDEGVVPVSFVITGSRGLGLLGTSSDGKTVRLLTAGSAVDSLKFWKLWRQYNPTAELSWESGGDFCPWEG